MRIDAHQHFWSLARGDYGWLTPELAPLYRDFGPDDLRPLLARHGIAGSVLVQAAPTEAETAYLLSLAERHEFVLGVVGWCDLAAPQAAESVAVLAARPKLKGLRPMLQDLSDDAWIRDAAIEPALREMERRGLVFDALVKPRHLPHLRRRLAQHPGLAVVIDHGAKPEIAAGRLAPWRAEMAELAAMPQVSCKLSGLLTEAAPGAGAAALRPFVETLLELFGPQRLLWGSDWPVLTLAASYEQWLSISDELLAGLDAGARAAVLGGNAGRIYHLQPRG